MPLGLIAGYLGGWIDALISRFTDAMLACPFLILAIALAAFLGPSLGNAMIAIGVTTTPIFVRLTRGQVMAVKVEDYVEAARAVGNPRWRIALVHILPNILPPLLVQATFSIAAAIIAEASLSFLGLGQQPPAPVLGQHAQFRAALSLNAPWMAVWPGLAIFLPCCPSICWATACATRSTRARIEKSRPLLAPPLGLSAAKIPIFLC